MTKQEYLDNLKKDAEKSHASKEPKARKRRRIVIFVLAIGSVVGLIASVVGTTSEKNRMYDDYIAAINAGEYTAAPFEFLDYEDTFKLWNDSIGNDVNVLMDGGKQYSRNGLDIYPTGNGKTKIVEATGTAHIIDAVASSLNVVDSTVFYRDDTTRHICSYDLKTGQTEEIYGGNVGEVFISNRYIYCVDFDQNSFVVAMDLQGLNPVVVVDKPTASFAICGGTALHLSTTQRLSTVNIETGTTYVLVHDIERFFVNGRIYAESKNSIFAFTTMGGQAREIYTSEDDSMRLVGVVDDLILFQESNVLKLWDGCEVKAVSTSNHDLYTCVVMCEDGSLRSVAYDQTEDGLELTVLDFEAALVGGV